MIVARTLARFWVDLSFIIYINPISHILSAIAQKQKPIGRGIVLGGTRGLPDDERRLGLDEGRAAAAAAVALGLGGDPKTDCRC